MFHVVEQWHRSRLAHTVLLIRWFATDLLLDLAERADPVQRFLRYRVGTDGMYIIDLSARVCHAGGFLNRAAAIQPCIARERVGQQVFQPQFKLFDLAPFHVATACQFAVGVPWRTCTRTWRYWCISILLRPIAVTPRGALPQVKQAMSIPI